MVAVGRAGRGVDEAPDAGVARGDQHVEEAGRRWSRWSQRIGERARHGAQRRLVQHEDRRPRQASRQTSRSRMSPSMKRWRCHAGSPTRRRTSSRLRRCPVAKLSRPTTSWPSASSVSSRCEPMKPALPVTSQRRGRPSRLMAPSVCGSSASAHGLTHSRQTRTPARRSAAGSNWHLTSTNTPLGCSFAAIVSRAGALRYSRVRDGRDDRVGARQVAPTGVSVDAVLVQRLRRRRRPDRARAR